MTVTSSPHGEHAGVRHTASTINDAQLDALYARLDAAEQETEATTAAAAHLTILMGKRSEKAERAAKTQRQRADIAERELHVLRSGLRANGADPTQIQNLWAQIKLRNRQWREAKAVIERVRKATANSFMAGPNAVDVVRVADVLAALAAPKEA